MDCQPKDIASSFLSFFSTAELHLILRECGRLGFPNFSKLENLFPERGNVFYIVEEIRYKKPLNIRVDELYALLKSMERFFALSINFRKKSNIYQINNSSGSEINSDEGEVAGGNIKQALEVIEIILELLDWLKENDNQKPLKKFFH